MTSATDELLVTGYPNSLRPELHKALKARGIDYWLAQGITFWNRDDGCECLAYGYKVNGVPKLAIKVVGFTDPEQAIAATLGSCNCTNDCTNGERTETCADGGTVSETYIRPTEEGSICPMPRASVIFEGQKLTFDEEDSARFAEIVKRHLRKLAGLEVEQ